MLIVLTNGQKKFNVNKCYLLHIGESNPTSYYFMERTLLQTTYEEKDLGVIVNKSLKPSKHFAEIVKKEITVFFWS